MTLRSAAWWRERGQQSWSGLAGGWPCHHGGRVRLGRAPCVWSRFLETGAESVDALCMLDWQSTFPLCGSAHREVIYAFPPLSLVRATVEKACVDLALCVLVVPVAILAP